MSANGIIDYEAPVGFSTKIVNEADIYQIRTVDSGIFKPIKKAGDFVEKGTLLAEIIDGIYGTVKSQVISEKNGLIYFEYNKPLINMNTVCYKIIADTM